MTRVAVVGAGVTGLAAAWHLNRHGAQAVLFEAAGRVGGRVGSATFSGRQVDTGPDALGPDPAIDELLDGIGLAEQVEIPDPPQAFRLTAAGELEPFGVGGGAMFGLAGGIFSLPDRLERVLGEAGVGFRLDGAVERVAERDDRVSVRADGSEDTFDAVILATGASAAATLIGGPPARQLARIRGISVTLVHLAFPEARIGREMNGTGYLADPAAGRLVTGCSWSSAKWRRLAGDPAILRASIREDGRGKVIDLPDEEIVARALEELRPVMELAGEPLETMITRYPEALVVRDADHESAVAAARASLAANPRIGLAGADFDGPGISRSIAGVRKTVDSIIEGIRND